MNGRIGLVGGAVATLALGAGGFLALHATMSERPHRSAEPSIAPPGGAATIYLHYYLWWTPQHWYDKLGATYPYGAEPLPRPGSTDQSGCHPTVSYGGATIVDIPAEGLYDQDLEETFDRHIRLASENGIQGFLVSWKGTGQTDQTPESSGYNRRLDLMVSRVGAFNDTHGDRFHLGLAFAAFGDYTRPAVAIINDLSYFSRHYGSDPMFHNAYSPKPMVMWLDSRKLPVETVRSVSAAEKPHLYLLGDETATSWERDAAYLDGTSYYWSTENPWTNPAAESSLIQLAAAVHVAGKRWFAPFIPGYNKELLGGTCVPRRGLETLDRIWAINARSHPDGWFGISWNEFVENTYLEPSLAYGSSYLFEVKRLSQR